MPAFMFEKITAPVYRSVQVAAVPAPAKDSRGVIVQMLDRLTETRLQRQAKALRKANHMSFTEADIKPT